MVTKDDIILAISNTGQTAEINNIVPIIKNMGAKIIAFTGQLDSPMALESDVVIDVGVEREACPMGLAPTASTTAALAMGDALAVALINSRSFDKKDFKRFHPGGSLGERLAVKVKEVMLTDDHLPISVLGSRVEQALKEIDSKGIGATVVVDSDNRLAGMITDGDLRRALAREGNIQQEKVEKVMSASPKTIDEDQSSAEALGVMELYGITHLIILDREKRVKGVGTVILMARVWGDILKGCCHMPRHYFLPALMWVRGRIFHLHRGMSFWKSPSSWFRAGSPY
jgi:arabinose-5-phosphate isomerase